MIVNLKFIMNKKEQQCNRLTFVVVVECTFYATRFSNLCMPFNDMIMCCGRRAGREKENIKRHKIYQLNVATKIMQHVLAVDEVKRATQRE